MLIILAFYKIPNPENSKIIKILILMVGCGKMLKMPAWEIYDLALLI
jgi:hypothetical protein